MVFKRLHFCVIFVTISLAICQVEDIDITHKPVDIGADPPGHLKPLGSHRAPEGPIDTIDYIPDPVVFYEKYVKPGKPLLMKGQARKIPAFDLWTDEYLRENFGSQKIVVETKKKETRNPNDGMQIKLSTFLDYYLRKQLYVVHDLTKGMKHDYHLLKSLLCGGFTKVLQTTVMWFSSGGTKSVLHNDNIDNINCIFEGNKRLVFFDKKYRDLIEDVNFVADKGYSKVDVDRVDMYEYPGFKDLPWYEATMEKGDCFFIPMNWYHHVHSFGDISRNLAVNIWFAHLYTFNYTDCEEKGELPETQPLSDFEFVSQLEMQRANLLENFAGLEQVQYDVFAKFIKNFYEDITNSEVDEMFALIDADKDRILSWEELQWFDLEEASKMFPGMFEGPEEFGHGEEDEEIKAVPDARLEEDKEGRDEL